MTGRVLGVELRRSAALWTAVVITLAGIAMLYPVLRGWGGRWTLLAEQQREYLFVLWPLALGAGAWQGRRDARSRVGELFATTPRPVRQRVAPTAVAMAIGVVLGYLGMFAAGAVQVLFTATYFPAGTVLTVAVGALSVVTAVWLGLAIGTLVPLPPTALTLIGLIVALWTASSSGGPLSALVSPSVFVDEFSAVADSVHLGQSIWFAAIAVAAFGLLAAANRWSRLVAALPVLLDFLVALSVLPDERAAFTVPDPQARALVCTPDLPQVCVTIVHSAALPDVVGPARRALTILADKLPEAPTSAVESATWRNHVSGPSWAPDRLPLLIDVTASGRARLSEQDLLERQLEGAGTLRCDNVSPDAAARHVAAREVAALWLLSQEPTRSTASTSDELVLEAWRVFQSLPFEEQRARVGAMRASSLQCEGRDLLDLLVAGGTPK